MQEKSLDLAELRQTVTARDKALIGSKPFPEAVKFVKERYGTTPEIAEAFVAWQQTIAGGSEGTKGNPTDRWHLKFDENTGKWVTIPNPGEGVG